MLAWSEGPITDVRKSRNHGYDVIVGGELFTDYSDHPRKLVTLNPNSNQQAPDAGHFSRWWDAYRKQLGLLRLLSEKSGRCGIAADYGGAYLMIDRGDIRQAPTVAAISGLHCRASGYGQFDGG